ncbi:MAG: PTS sugar transporter subunit IIA [bacterium]|nr:PTS sugar transporter subunit IIA [bacterium]
MLNLSSILSPDCIQLDLRASDKKEAIQELVGLFVAAGQLDDSDDLANELLAQEKRVSTGIGDGIAIPHKLTKCASRTMIAFGRKNDGLNFEALDRQPVYLLFLILGPPHKVTEHLQVLSKLSRLLHNRNLRQHLFDAQQPNEILEIICRYETV